MKRADNVLRNIVSNVIGGSINTTASLVFLPAAIALSGIAEYGQWLILSAGLQLLATTDLGIANGIIYFTARTVREGRTAEHAYVSAGLAMFAGLTMLALPAYAAVMWLVGTQTTMSEVSRAEYQTMLFEIALPCLGLILLTRPFRAQLRGFELFAVDRTTQVIGVVIRAAGYALVAYLGWAVIGVAVVEALSLATPGALAAGYCIRSRVISYRFGRYQDIRSVQVPLFKYSIRSFSGSVSNILVLQAPLALVGVAANTNAVTLFAAAFRIFTSIFQVTVWITEPFMPAVARTRESLSSRSMQDLAGDLSAICASVVMTIAGIFIGCASDVLRLWLGPEFRPAGTGLAILMVASILLAFYWPGVVLCNSSGRPGIVVGPSYVYACVALVACGVGAFWGLALAATGILIGVSAGLMALARRVRAVFGYGLQFGGRLGASVSVFAAVPASVGGAISRALEGDSRLNALYALVCAAIGGVGVWIIRWPAIQPALRNAAQSTSRRH